MLHPDHELHRQPARGRPRHRELRPGAASRSPPGSGRHPHRGAPRRRDRPGRAAGGRVRSPRLLDAAHPRRRRDDRAHGRVLPAGEAAAGGLDPRGRPPRRHQPAAAPARRRWTDPRRRGDGLERAHRRADPRARTDEIPDAIDDGEFFEMQTFRRRSSELVLAALVDRETAANAATNRHDFEIALDRAEKLVLAKKVAAGRGRGASEPRPRRARAAEGRRRSRTARRRRLTCAPACASPSGSAARRRLHPRSSSITVIGMLVIT